MGKVLGKRGSRVQSGAGLRLAPLTKGDLERVEDLNTTPETVKLLGEDGEGAPCLWSWRRFFGCDNKAQSEKQKVTRRTTSN